MGKIEKKGKKWKLADAIESSRREREGYSYATWCGPCQMMAPVLEQVGIQLRDRVQVVKIDTDKYPQLATQYQIQALPTLVLFKNGQPVERIEGAMQAPQLIQQLQMLL